MEQTMRRQEQLPGAFSGTTTDWCRSVLDDDGVVRNSVARIEDGVLHIEQGPLVGQEARVKKIDRHKRWCLVDVGEGDSAFRELLPLDVPSKT